jgi:hypothetical protein
MNELYCWSLSIKMWHCRLWLYRWHCVTHWDWISPLFHHSVRFVFPYFTSRYWFFNVKYYYFCVLTLFDYNYHLRWTAVRTRWDHHPSHLQYFSSLNHCGKMWMSWKNIWDVSEMNPSRIKRSRTHVSFILLLLSQ